MLSSLLNKGNALSKRSLIDRAGLTRSLRRKLRCTRLINAKNVFPAPDANFDIDFNRGYMYLHGKGILKLSDVFANFTTRGSSGTYYGLVNNELTLLTAGSNVPRISYDYVTEKYYYLIEETIANQIRNNTMVGAVIGGNAPNNWDSSTSLAGLTRQIVGKGIENGIDYIDVRWFGTSNAQTISGTLVRPESLTQTTSTLGQTWVGSFFTKLVAGTLQNVELAVELDERTSIGTFVTSTKNIIVPTSSPLIKQRVFANKILATAGKVTTRLTMSFEVDLPIDFTLRVGLPQLEANNLVPTSPVKTTAGVATRARDTCTILASYYLDAISHIQGTFIFKGKTSDNNKNCSALSLSDGTTNNRITLRATTNTGRAYAFNIIGGATVSAPNIAIPLNEQSQYSVYALGYMDDNIFIYVNGNFVRNPAPCNLPPINGLRIGGEGNNANPVNGHIERIIYYPEYVGERALIGVEF